MYKKVKRDKEIMVNVLTFQTFAFYTVISKCSGMANNVDPDPTASGAVWSESAPIAYAILSETLVYEI